MKKEFTYKSSGVDIDKANVFVDAIKKDVAKTIQPGTLLRKGAFGGLFALDVKKYKEPILVSSTDGVGTKLLLAQTLNKHDTVGIDLVAMNINDILCVGAKPLFFLDYIACGKLKPKILKDVVKGISRGCVQSGCSLIGGETAEMPDMYKGDEYDLAGFTVGVVEKKKMLDGSKIVKGDCVIGFPSSGIHSNGYSLVRKVLSKQEQKKWDKELLAPTKIYAKEVLPLIENFQLKGIAHITGGAWYEKLTKILPKGKCFHINRGSWPIPKVFSILQKKGRISDIEMYRTFNMGIGLAVVVSKVDQNKIESFLKRRKIKYYRIGEVALNQKKKIVFSD